MRLRLLPMLLFLLVCAGALRVRYQDPYDLVLTQDEVVLRSNDPWYHMRLVDNLLRSFPHRLTFDPYALYPKGQDVGYAPLLDLIAAGPARLLGAPPPDYWPMLLAAMLPPVFGALVLLAVFLIGEALFDPPFNQWTGLLASAIVAFAPGQFLMVSLVGFFDHHVLEVFLSTLVVLFAIRALRRDSTRFAIFAGVTLGLYLLAWQGGVVFVAVLLGWFTVSVWFDASPARIFRLALAMFPAALAVLLPFTPWGEVVQRPALAILAVSVVVVGMKLMERWRAESMLLPLIALAVMFSGLFHAAASHVSLLDYFRKGPGVWEIRPLLFATGRFSISPAIEEFGQSTWLILPGLALIAWKWLRGRGQQGQAELGLFLATSCGWLAGTLMMRRFAYYFLAYAALLAAHFCAELARAAAHRSGNWAAAGVGVAAAALLVLPSLAPAFLTGQPDLSRLSGPAAAGPSADWREALDWMRHNTAEPLGSPDAYYQVFDARTFHYPPSAYGVMVWGMQGFWVTRIAHRIPTDNPTWIGSQSAAAFYVETNPEAAARLLDGLGVRYVIAPFSVSLSEGAGGDTAAGEFAIMASWLGRDRNTLVERFYFPDRKGRAKLLYYPAYFQSMAPRLCLFGARAVEPDHIGLVEYRHEKGGDTIDGAGRNVVTRYREFNNFVEAQKVQAATPGSRIVSDDPTKSCVPLSALDRFHMVHHSPSRAISADEDVYVVHIYEYR